MSFHNISEYDNLMKVILVGDSGVGKSTLLSAFCDKEYSDYYISTIGVDFKIKMVEVCDKKVKLQIWDTAGQERYRSIVKSYYRGANAILLVFDLTSIQSFHKLGTWMEEIKSNMRHNNYKIILVGSKSDVVYGNCIPQEKIDAFAKQHKLDYIAVSSKKNINIDTAFNKIVKDVLMSQKSGETSTTKILKKNKDKCCN